MLSVAHFQLAVILLLTVLLYLFSRKTVLRTPPSPPGSLPLLGHLFTMPKSHEWLTYRQWASDLESDIICMKVLGKYIIVLNSLRAANEVFDGKAAASSDRPKLYALREILGFDWIYGIMPYGKKFLEIRKAANCYLNRGPVKAYQPLQLDSARSCVKHLIDNPSAFVQHFREMAGHTILAATYGLNPKREDAYFHTVFMAVQGLNLGLSRRALVYDFFPPIKLVPHWILRMGFKEEAQMFRKHITALPDLGLCETVASLNRGDAPLSIAASMISDGNLSNDVIRSVTGSLYLAGTETTAAILANFCLAMIQYPAAQLKAQAEIDSVTGGHRLPTFEDEPSLPFVSALVKEVLRWRVVTPLATPHCLSTDITYQGYHLPAGSTVIGNTFAMLHDDNLFPDPSIFRPERFFDCPSNTADLLFGFGGRVCPGRYLAKSSVWISIVTMLSSLHIASLENDMDKIVGEETTPGVVSFPAPFGCKIIPRSETAKDLIMSAHEE